jgi:hypothetical protein
MTVHSQHQPSGKAVPDDVRDRRDACPTEYIRLRCAQSLAPKVAVPAPPVWQRRQSNWQLTVSPRRTLRPNSRPRIGLAAMVAVGEAAARFPSPIRPRPCIQTPACASRPRSLATAARRPPDSVCSPPWLPLYRTMNLGPVAASGRAPPSAAGFLPTSIWFLASRGPTAALLRLVQRTQPRSYSLASAWLERPAKVYGAPTLVAASENFLPRVDFRRRLANLGPPLFTA